ncbi:MAG: isoaspartyl peptidase/L-asparaginase family protein [Bacteroidota bacterium]
MNSRKYRRRDFIKTSSLVASSMTLPLTEACGATDEVTKPIIISTWNHGARANEVGFRILMEGGEAIDAVQQGVMVVESDPNVRTVGIGGYPDRDGIVTLDACIMKGDGSCGSVAFLQDIENPIAVARKVMDLTPHVMLAGAGAKKFALENGFEEVNLLTEASKKDYENWLKKSDYKPVINVENHDTISTLAIDSEGKIAGSCTTSGLSYKYHGRVGDSPIIGAGLFVDQEVGGACATGMGEEVIRTAGSAVVVELMSSGMSPQEACEAIIKRIDKKRNGRDVQIGFLALDTNGNYGAYGLRAGFTYAVKHQNLDTIEKAGNLN